MAELRPELHRYCARLTGSIVDGEDVVQETLAKAYYAISMAAEMPPTTRPGERARLRQYAALFNAQSREALRALIAEDCRLDLVSRVERRGPAVGEYYARYADQRDVRAAVGVLEDAHGGRLALGIYSTRSSANPTTFVLIEWRGDKLSLIRDFRYVPHIADEVMLGRATFRLVD
ncbi:MAG TPA: sigma factor [Polyangia bacterium]